jgi:type II secretory pathway component GspD/PulD (secretin)
METVQGDQHTNILQAPKLTVANGQRAGIKINDSRFFVTGVDIVRSGEQMVFVPKNECLSTGMTMSVQPVVSADRRYVSLNLKVSQSELASSPVPLFPIVMPVMPLNENGSRDKPVFFTQYVQQPTVNTRVLEKTLAIPDGNTVLMGGWKKVTESRKESGPPVLSKVPYVNRLFKNVGYGRQEETVLVMVTPRIIIAEQEEARCSTPEPIPAPRIVRARTRQGVSPAAGGVEEQEEPPTSAVESLLKKYHQACAAGCLEEACSLAIRALALDPTCFDKKR